MAEDRITPAAGAPQSLLFVPASRPERFGKALASGAELVCADLEDSVPEDGKDAARAIIVDALAAGQPLAVRINALTTAAGLADLLALSSAARAPTAILLPKAESPDEVRIVASRFADGLPVIPLIETPRGLARAAGIGGAATVAAMLFGGVDMAAELGVAFAREPLAPARGAFLLACAEAGVAGIDTPCITLDDMDQAGREAIAARQQGFRGKAAIHPAQIAPINTAFAPSTGEVAEAREAIAAFMAAGQHAVRFKGRMLERPVIANYRRILAQADTMKDNKNA